jgi:hypothetical protein
VTKQLVPHAQRDPMAIPEAPAGRRLRDAVDAVLAELGEDASPDTMRRHEELLRSALAWTAATGETCRVPLAVTAVRRAQRGLAANDQRQATVALLAARDGLRLPGPRAH